MLDNQKVVDVIVSNNSLHDGFWMILEDLTTKQVTTKKYKFDDINGGDYANTTFNVSECMMELMDTGESYPQITDLEVSGEYKVFQENGATFLLTSQKVEKLNFDNISVACNKATIIELEESLDLSNISKCQVLSDRVLLFSKDSSNIKEIKLETPKMADKLDSPAKDNKDTDSKLVSYEAKQIRNLLKISQPVKHKISNIGGFVVYGSHPNQVYSLRNYCRLTSNQKKQRLSVKTENVLEGGS